MSPSGTSTCRACATAPPRLILRSRHVGFHEGPLRDIVHAFKYGGHRSLAGELVPLLEDAGRDLLTAADVAVAVPLHPVKQWRRGFNQAGVLARGLPVRVVAALRKPKASASQTGLTTQQRAANVQSAFEASWRLRVGTWAGRPEGIAARLPESLRARLARRWSVHGLSVLLVDDVHTTGATLEACARVLLAYGARDVSALTVARVARR